MTVGELRAELARLCEKNEAAADWPVAWESGDTGYWEVDEVSKNGPLTVHCGSSPSVLAERVCVLSVLYG